MQSILEKRGKFLLAYRLEDLAQVQPTNIFALDIETHGENKIVGDCPYYEHHGICGVSLANSQGDAVYAVIDDGRSYGGIPVRKFTEYLNSNWFLSGRVAVFHNCKFDVGFLQERGLCADQVKIHDTWIMNSIKNNCSYKSNKLKDIIRERFKIETESEEVIKKWLEDNKTEDYGDLPIELIGPYACDDVRYTLAVMFTHQEITKEEWIIHDRLVRNQLHLIEAEKRGIALNLSSLKDKLGFLIDEQKASEKFIIQSLNGMQFDIKNRQEMLKILHAKGLHPGPRDSYGEMKYVIDREFLESLENELAQEYLVYANRQDFIKNFSGKLGVMNTRIWRSESGETGFHVYHWPSVHSKGGLPQVRKPDFVEDVEAKDTVREIFVPRSGHNFVTIQFADLPLLIMASYIKDAELLQAVLSGRALELMSIRSDQEQRVCSLWLRKQLEGSGFAVFTRRLLLAGIKLKDDKAVYALNDNLDKCLKCKDGAVTYKDFNNKLSNLLANAPMMDRLGRLVQPEKEKLWRAFSILVSSNVGGIISLYLDILCRTAQKTGANLVLAHDREMLFEVSGNSQEFEMAVAKIIKTEIVQPSPMIRMAIQKKWASIYRDAHE
jgi:hypothetical protein